MVYAVFCAVVLVLLVFLRWRRLNNGEVCVLVLGDVGRSPRMTNHVRSLLKHRYHVSYVGYYETPLPDDLMNHSRLRSMPLENYLNVARPVLIRYVSSLLDRMTSLTLALTRVGRVEYYLIQNPPPIPVFMLCYLFSLLLGGKIIVDWHNYCHSVLAFKLSRSDDILIRLVRFYEWIMSRLSHVNLTVTEAMKTDLRHSFGATAVVFYDRPSAIFRPISVDTKVAFLRRVFKKIGLSDYDSKHPPAVLVSSSSWTEDEDFGLLLTALERYDAQPKLPSLVCFITGKGPTKDSYVRAIQQRTWTKVRIETPWLTLEDYALLLASADLGVCLHVSTSGLDLPMKIVDMFGCGLPVCAVGFPCLGELVEHDVHGRVFRSPVELYDCLRDLFQDFPQDQERLSFYRSSILSRPQFSWDTNWDAVVKPLL